VYRIIKFLSLILFLCLLIACAAGKKPALEEIPGKPAPSNLIVESGNQKLNLIWNTNRSESTIISGYNIYILEEPINEDNRPHRVKSDINPVNNLPYPGDENPEITFETYTAENLLNSVKYYVGVTTIFADKSESALSNVVKITCYPRGIVTIKDRMMGAMHGFSFGLDNYVDYNDITNDLYFVARDAGNIMGSPDRNEGVLKHTEFASLGRLKKLDDSRNFKNLAFKNRIFVAEGNGYVLRLEDGSMAKILVKQVDSSTYKKQVVFEYIYLGQ